ncbi:MAG: PAS domain S-box protein [Deltaproteobacteria bacterium]|nr:PAS domain S-box protein [Deltaproteobacteria bacterium]
MTPNEQALREKISLLEKEVKDLRLLLENKEEMPKECPIPDVISVFTNIPDDEILEDYICEKFRNFAKGELGIFLSVSESDILTIESVQGNSESVENLERLIGFSPLGMKFPRRVFPVKSTKGHRSVVRYFENIRDVAHPEFSEELLQNIQNQLALEGVYTIRIEIGDKTIGYVSVFCMNKSDCTDSFEAASKLLSITLKNHEILKDKVRESLKHEFVFENMPVSMTISTVVYDKDGNPENFRFLNVNKMWSEITHVSKEDAIGSTLFDLVSEADIAVFHNFLKCVNERKLVRFTHHLVRFNKTVQMLLAPFDEDTVISLSVDISEMNDAYEKIANLEKQHRLLLEGQRDAVVTSDEKGFLTYCSDAVRKFGGYDPLESIGTHISQYLNLEKYELENLMSQVMTSDSPVVLEAPYLRSDGTVIPIEVVVNAIHEEGAPSQFHCIMRDIQFKKHLETVMQKGDILLRGVINAIPDPIMVHDSTGKMAHCNIAANIFWRNSQKSENSVCSLLFDEVVRTGEARKTQMFITEKNSWFDVRAWPVPDENDEIDAVVEHLRDITSEKLMQLKLAESEADMAAIIDNVHDGIIALNRELKVLLVNKTAMEFIKVHASEIKGMDLSDVIDFYTVKTREPLSFSLSMPQLVELFDQNGNWHLVELKLALNNLKEFEGPVHIITLRDETALHAAGMQLAASEKLYRTIIHNFPVGIISLDSHLIVKECNGKFAALLGKEITEIIGENVSFFGFKGIADACEESINGREGYFEGSLYLEKSDSVRAVSFRTVSVKNEENIITGVIGSLQDITGQKINEKMRLDELSRISRQKDALLEVSLIPPSTESNDVYRTITRNCASTLEIDLCALYMVDSIKSEYNCISMYSARRGRYIPGKFHKSRDIGGILRKLRKSDFITVNSDEIEESGIGFHHRTSTEINLFPVRIGGKISGFILIEDAASDRNWFNDEIHFISELCAQVALFSVKESSEKEVTRRHKLEMRMQQTQKLESLGILAGGIAHDFNNLLMGILGNASLALMEIPEYSPARETIQSVEKTSRRAAELIKQLLAYSGKGKFVLEKIDPGALVEEMAHLLEVTIPKNVSIRYKFRENVPVIEGDPTKIRQIVMNLITNAADAIGKVSGLITISTGSMECDEEYLQDNYTEYELPPGTYSFIEVSDTGEGMEKAVLGRIFDPFYTTKFTGRGLGLAAVVGIVRGHRGGIKVYSEVGQGSTFKVVFPSKTGSRSVEISALEEKDDNAGGLILIVDDETTVRNVAAKMVKRLGYEVITAIDGVDGLNIFKERCDEVGLVLMDLTMPHMDGEECFREMRNVRSNVKVILSSGYNEQELISRFAGKGLSGFIQKPYSISQLREIVANVFRKKV